MGCDDSMTRGRVLVAGGDAPSRESLAAALAATGDRTVTHAATGEVSDAVANADVDCLVATPAAAETVDGVPTVLWTDERPADLPDALVAAAEGVVARDADADRVAEAVDWAVRAADCGETDDSRERIERLHEAAADIAACRREAAVYRKAVEAAEGILDFDTCGIDAVEDGYFVPQAVSTGMDESGYERLPVGEGIAGQTWRRDEAIVVDDVRDREDATPADDSYRSVLSVPVEGVGVFQAGSTAVGAFDDRDCELAELLLAHVGEAARRIRVEAELRERRATVERLHEVTADVVACREESTLFEKTVEAAAGVLDFSACSVLVADEAGDLVIRASSAAEIPVGERMAPDTGIAGETYRTGATHHIDDVRTVDGARPFDDDYRAALSVPIGDAGVFQAISTTVGAYDDADVRMAELLVSHVTETLTRIRAENERRERERRLTEERDRLAALFENVPDPVVAYEFDDGDAVVRDVNGAFEETFGYTAADVVGEDIDDYIVPEDRQAEAERLNRRLQAGESLQTTSRRLAEDGLRDFLLHVVPLQVGERSVEGYGIYTDITDQKRRERELERRTETLDQFASIVSHDLRNPLNVADGYLEVARETGTDEHFDRVAQSHERMSRMIDELLTLARRGEIVGETRPVELATVATDAWESVATPDLDLRVEADGVVDADPERFSELLANLFRNAAEHASPAGAARVRVGTSETGFYVADDGPGVPEDRRERVFESGFTTAEDGTGFGLTIVRQLAQAHGWSVSITESESGGARFEFDLPTDADAADTATV